MSSFHLFSVFTPLLQVSALPAPTDADLKLACKEVTFTVSGTAQNRNISSVDFTNLEALTTSLTNNNFPTFEESGSQEIATWYCEPSRLSLEIDALQILNGPITTNREYWTALGGTALASLPNEPYNVDLYSWVDYARKEGYATLAIDHLDTDNSSHPDPMNIVQSPYQVELYHGLAQQIKGADRKLPIAENIPETDICGRVVWICDRQLDGERASGRLRGDHSDSMAKVCAAFVARDCKSGSYVSEPSGSFAVWEFASGISDDANRDDEDGVVLR